MLDSPVLGRKEYTENRRTSQFCTALVALGFLHGHNYIDRHGLYSLIMAPA